MSLSNYTGNRYKLRESTKFRDGSGTTQLVRDQITGYNLYVIPSPFSNCQLWGISTVSCLLADRQYDQINTRLLEIKQLCRIVKPLCQIDVRKEIFNAIEPYLKIRSHMDYTSTNYSQMVGLIIDTPNS